MALYNRRTRQMVQDTPREGIRIGATVKAMGGWLVKVDAAHVDEFGVLRCEGHVVARPLMADNLAGETYPRIMWAAF